MDSQQNSGLTLVIGNDLEIWMCIMERLIRTLTRRIARYQLVVDVNFRNGQPVTAQSPR